MLGWIVNVVSSLAQWAYRIGKDNGPAVGTASRRTWEGLAILGRAQFWVSVGMLAGLALGLLYAT